MRELDHFVVSDELQISASGEASLIVEGRIWCEHGMFVDIRQILDLNKLGQARVVRYSFHAGLSGSPPRSIFRYDNAHVYVREGHMDEHHKHRFDSATWQEIRPPVWIGYRNQPHMWEVLSELQEWWHEVGQYMTDPET